MAAPLFLDQKVDMVMLFGVTMIGVFGMMGLMLWMRFQRAQAEARARQDEREQKRLELEEKRLQAEETARYEAQMREEEKLTSDKAGLGSGGYIVMDMPESERALFHDLLKGFEDYAKLKGYHVSFSIDSSLKGRIAFKFTVSDGFVVGPERVREDFKEYVDQVRNGEIDDFDKIPVIMSIEEHNLVVALLKNRISFLQHSYNLSQTSVKYYESLITNTRHFPALPAPTVVVQTGGTMDSRNYNATNSSRLIQGDANTFTDSSVNIGSSFNERQERIAALDNMLGKLKATEMKNESVQKAERELSKVRDELAEYPEPDKSSIRKWLEYAKNSMTGAILGYETLEAAKKLWELFGLS
jgi:hypothetical protein